MPEGDTIHTVAGVLRPDLEGVELLRLSLPNGEVELARPTIVGEVRAVGKHLLIEFSDPTRTRPRVLRVHLGMKGSWHRYRPGEAWQRPASQQHVLLDTQQWSFVCFRPPQAVVYPDLHSVDAGIVGSLGPDLLAAELDLSEVVRRARLPANRRRPIASVLLDQRVACGIGNVYKSETLFSARVRHSRRTEDVTDDELTALFQTARTWVQANVARPRWRVTTTTSDHDVTADERHWVYRRVNKPCRRCATPVQAARTGVEARMTYFCPACQA